MAEKKTETKSLEDVNQKIQELHAYLPKELFRDERAPRTKDGKPNKGMILTAAVSHLLQLQNQVDIHNREEVELLTKLAEYREKEFKLLGENRIDTSQINFNNTSAEQALGSIGVGPLAGQYNYASSTVSSSNNNTPIRESPVATNASALSSESPGLKYYGNTNTDGHAKVENKSPGYRSSNAANYNI